MTDRAKFEQMLEALINEDQATAKEIFHDIVVAKSREIYESLLAEDFEEEEVEEGMEISVKETDDEEGLEMDEAGDEFGGDPSDDLLSDVESDGEEDEFGGDEFGGEEEEEEEGDIEDRVMDLEDALEDLKAEFEELMAGEEGEGDDDSDSEEGEEEFGGEDDEEKEEGYNFEDMEDDQFEESLMREYVEKVSAPKHGDNGVNTKSIVAGKNDMGGTTANIAKGGEAKGEGTKGGLLNPSTKPQDAGNVNVPGSKTATKLKPVGKKAGSESADNKKSTLGSR